MDEPQTGPQPPTGPATGADRGAPPMPSPPRPGPTGEPAGLAGDPGAVAPTLPSTGARVVGFVAILVAGAAGGFIGYAVTDLQCTGDCTVSRGIGGLVGAVIAAVGVAVVVQLALRAMHEWRIIEARGGPEAARGGRRPPRPAPPATRPRPRVR
jgi:hypothetical protein